MGARETQDRRQIQRTREPTAEADRKMRDLGKSLRKYVRTPTVKG